MTSDVFTLESLTPPWMSQCSSLPWTSKRSWSLLSDEVALRTGAGGADLSVGLEIDFARELKGGNAIVAGVKFIDVDYEKSNVRGIPFVLDTTFFGAVVGFTFD